MKLDYSLSTVAKEIHTLNVVENDAVITTVFFDTRKIFHPTNGLFFCLKSGRRDGHDYIQDAYEKGIRYFVVSNDFKKNVPDDCVLLVVNDTLSALQELAKFHRLQFSYPVIGITGSTGKTTVKEWLYQLLQEEFKIVRSPKSFNSQLGVALSLLEMSHQHNLAIIEAGISQPGEMERLAEIIQPTIGVLTKIGTAHRENFSSPEEIFLEKIKLFNKTQIIFLGESNRKFITSFNDNFYFPTVAIEKDQLQQWTASYIDNIELAVSIVYFLTKKEVSIEQLNILPQLAMRMEVFEGINQTTIINDAYNLDVDALKQSLDFLVNSNVRPKSAVIIVAHEIQPTYKIAIEHLIENYPIDSLSFVSSAEDVDFDKYTNCTILIKGYRNSSGQRLAQKFKLQKHETVVEIDMDALRNNFNFFRSKIQPTTKMLVMVKAFAYGAGAEKIAAFLERNNVDYLGVAYGDEGVALRKAGIKTPILVMNAEPYSYETIIENNLEPAIFSQKSLEEFVKTLINVGKENYPIHLKIDTGMHRLGFSPNEINQVIETIKTQPEITVKSVYSHLADADNFESDSYSHQQFQVFDKVLHSLREELPYNFIAHILNTEGILRFPEHQYGMVRMGIGMYGTVSNKEISKYLYAGVFWKTIISQIRELPIGERISYGGIFTTNRDSRIATIPVGYADGLRRSYGSSGGVVYINGTECPIVGTICMDMCMVDVTDVSCEEGDEVEIIGNHITLDKFAKKLGTIPYEVLTSISKRVHRIYLNE